MNVRTLALIIPKAYIWLAALDLPKILDAALALYGTTEKAGPGNNPVILDWAKDLDLAYGTDEIPWCGLFAAIVAKRAGKPVVAAPLWARNWLKFGTKADTPSLGDVLVFARGAGGHVGFYIGEDDACYHVLGGNQGDAVSIVRIDKRRLLGARRPVWAIAQPASVQPVKLATGGAPVSTNEA